MEVIPTKPELGVTPQNFSVLYPRLYHMAHEDAWPAIQRYGLLTTQSILKLWEIGSSQRTLVQKQIRKNPIELMHQQHGKVVIRDQRSMHENKLRPALIDCTPEQWCQLLNSKVFFWPSLERLLTHMAARMNRGRTHLVLTIDAYRFIRAYENKITLCPINSGNTIPFAQKRGKETFMRMRDYPFAARRGRGAYSTVVELTVDQDVPDILDFLIAVDYRMSSEGKTLHISRVAEPPQMGA